MSLVDVDRYESPWEAYLAAGRLEVEGLSSVVVHPYHIWAYWPLALALGWVRVQVEDRESALAREIARKHRAGHYQSLLSEQFPADWRSVCPRCGGNDIRKRALWCEVLLCIALVMVPAIFPVRRSRHQCRTCHYRWKG
jgi:hypothetical protein